MAEEMCSIPDDPTESESPSSGANRVSIIRSRSLSHREPMAEESLQGRSLSHREPMAEESLQERCSIPDEPAQSAYCPSAAPEGGHALVPALEKGRNDTIAT